MYTFEPLNSESSDVWDKILNNCPNSTAFHSSTWRNALAGSFKQIDSHLLSDSGKWHDDWRIACFRFSTYSQYQDATLNAVESVRWDSTY